jgi:acetate kinase
MCNPPFGWPMSILVFNAGSSSLKFALFDDQAAENLGSGSIDWTSDRHAAKLKLRRPDGSELHDELGVPDDRAAVSHALASLVQSKSLSPTFQDVKAVGHRVVHGGTEFQSSIVIDTSVKDAIARLSELAPLHNPCALEAIHGAEDILPNVPQVAVFDTAFFAKLPPKAFLYALPYEWFADWGIRRFGFHGISHQYCAQRAAQMLGSSRLRLVICHLGNGCSATAAQGEDAVATTMGFTPMDGLMMGTRAGSVDPGILLYLLQHRSLSIKDLDQSLNHRSGLLGLSGISSDFREVEAAAMQGRDRARLALEIYADKVRTTIGTLTTSLGGIDALVFTAGVGEHSASLRLAACTGLEFLGLKLDPERNASCEPDVDIAAAESRARILIIHTREELMIARAASLQLDTKQLGL